MKLLIATTNRGKAAEISARLGGMFEKILSLKDLPPIQAPSETGSTFAENARQKAAYYRRATGLPALADDSGLIVDALGGAPGVQTARFAPTESEGIQKILERLSHVGDARDMSSRSARFECALCLDLGRRRIETTGQVEGTIALAPQGANGFGYDPIFYYPPLEKTFAQMASQEKGAVSHRSRALTALSTEIAAASPDR